MSERGPLINHHVGLEHVVELAQRELNADAAYVAELADGKLVFRAAAGDLDSFNIVLGDGPPATQSYCSRLVAGDIPSLIRDTSVDRRVTDLAEAAPIGSYVGVPLRLPDGSIYGTFCAIRRAPDPRLDQRHVRLMSMLAELIVRELAEGEDEERLRADLRRLLTDERVRVAYQPIFQLADDRCLGVEALARFPAPFAPPDQIFARAEQLGLAVELERLVIGLAWRAIPKLPTGCFLAVNVSPHALLELAHRANRARALPLSKVVVEVTEYSIIEAYAVLRDELEPLRRRGLRIAVDDAGAGYASLRHVLELRPDFIKLDRWLIDGLAGDGARRVAVGAFIALARELGSKVIAEGVERQVDLEAVRELGVDAAQGFLLGRPAVEEAALEGWFRQRPRGGRRLRAAGGVRTPGVQRLAERIALEQERERLELDQRVSNRLEAVGQLAAGIAHEINTPLQYVGDSLTFLKNSIDELLTLTERYRQTLYSETPVALEERREAMRRAEQEADVEYLCERIPAAFARTADGIARVRAIVHAMKRFSHASGTEMAPADINQAIETTLAVCRHEYKYVADVRLELGELPPVSCNIVELNQVFLNLILNAAQAIEEKVADSNERGEIRIATRVEGGEVVIEVADDGGGIPPELQDRIYEPFFTTKEVGRGTGQGLALARSTVERHAGTLSCRSVVGRGTTFAIRLPLRAAGELGLGEAA